MADFAVKFSSVGGSFMVKMQSEADEFSAGFGDFQTVTKNEFDYYDGAYEITPRVNAQTVNTANKVMSDDLTVKAIPNNYGLITYNGYEITVS